MKKENEIWKVIPNYENYEASNFGRIRSIDRVVKRDRYTTRKIKGKILQQFAKNSGYLQVNLSKSTISGYCNNLHKDPNGYIWKYETKK